MSGSARRSIAPLALLAAASQAAAELNFLVMADWGGSDLFPYTTQPELSTASGMGKVASQLQAAFSLAVGDNFYTYGVKSATDARFKHTFEHVFTDPALSFPFYVVAGNHDHNGNVTAQIAYSKLSSRWTFPSSWYTFTRDVGGGATLQVVMIDTVVLFGNSDEIDGATGEVRTLAGSELRGPADRSRAQTQLEWLQQTLAASSADFLIVAGHYPVWSICEHGPTSQMVDSIKPLLEKYKVTAFIAGHDHCMETFVDGEVDYHGMGSAHENDKSTEHESQVPKGSLKFHTPGKSGGFGSFTVNETSFIARHHEGDGTLLYTHPSRAPRNAPVAASR